MGLEELAGLLEEAVEAVEEALDALDDWGPSGMRSGQYRSDLAADRAAVELLLAGGVGVVSEESGAHRSERPVTVLLDPLDGSTNAERGVPWYATSLCALDEEGPAVAVVADLAGGRRYRAIRGKGATRDGRPIAASGVEQLEQAFLGLSGLPSHHFGWRQFRALGAVSLDLCAVADGTLDGFVDCSFDAHGPWDYLGGLLVCREAGAVVTDARGRELVALDHGARRTPLAASTPALLDQLVAERSRGIVQA